MVCGVQVEGVVSKLQAMLEKILLEGPQNSIHRSGSVSW